MKKTIIFAIMLIAIMIFASCAKSGALIDTDTLKVERDGAITRIYDRAGDEEYTFRASKVHKDEITEELKEDRAAVDTDTIKIIALYGGGFIVEDKTANAVYRIENGNVKLVEPSAIETTA